MTRAVGLMMLVVLLLMLPAPASAQDSSPPITKADALKSVRISPRPGWHELVSDENHFRVLFPGEAQINDDVISVKGFKLANSSGKWTAWCSDLGRIIPNNESVLRNSYQQALSGMIHSRNYLFASGDVFLQGRLGAEFVIHTGGQIRYVRAFIFGRRLYTLSVARKRTNQMGDEIPADVQQFFDSFAYWD